MKQCNDSKKHGVQIKVKLMLLSVRYKQAWMIGIKFMDI